MTDKTPTKTSTRSRTRQMRQMLIGLLALTSLPAAALAQATAPTPIGSPLPTWHAVDVCKRDSVTDQCDLFEQRAARTVSGSWAFVPEDVRAKCLAESAKPVAQSWRLLSGCIETAMSRSTDRHAVLTAKTPTEPVPPRKILPMVPPAEEKSEAQPGDPSTPPSIPAAVPPTTTVAPPAAAAASPVPEAKKP